MQYLRKIIGSIGPGFIMAAVVLGPGSITTSSKIGATQGYAFLWVILLSALLMAVYTNVSVCFGKLHRTTILSAIATKYGRWFAVAIGVSSFLSSLSFQFGNNLGVGMGIFGLHSYNLSRRQKPLFLVRYFRICMSGFLL